jgi:hypothetical protein
VATPAAPAPQAADPLPQAAKPISGFALLAQVLWGFLGRLFGRG